MESIAKPDLGNRVQALAALRENRGWPELAQIVKERMEREFLLLSHALMRGEPWSQEELAYKRGFFAGMKFLLDSPDLNESKLERALRQQENAERSE